MRRYCQEKSSRPELPLAQEQDHGSFSKAEEGNSKREGRRYEPPLPFNRSEKISKLKALVPQSSLAPVAPVTPKDGAAVLPARSAQWFEKGGLAQAQSPRGAESMVRFMHSAPLPPSWQKAREYLFWVSDCGKLNAEAFHQLECFPIENLIVAYPTSAAEVWRTGLSAIQSGLFKWAFLKVSEGCEPSTLRKLQLASEKVNCRTFIFCSRPLPHWLFRFSLETGS